MRNRTLATLLVVGILAGAGVGYLVCLEKSQSSLGLCTPFGSLSGSIPAGINITVSYQGDWRLAVAEFNSGQTKASTLNSVCYYEGSGTVSLYVSIANFGGWNTVYALAHKWGTTGTLTVIVMAGPSMSSNSTVSSYGDASTSISFLR